jgi:UDP-N-acetylglucosamine 2-epimerase (non-hydrolysing)
MTRPKVISIIGTRPEAIKMAPVIGELRRRSDRFDHLLVTTAQHREMLDQVLRAFEIEPDIDLALMQQNQGLAEFASRSLSSLGRLLADLRPDAVLVQGDTTTVMTAALAAFYQAVPVGHVEAGLRSFDRRNPFPEEINRRIAGCISDYHFAPTKRARNNLLNEGVADDKIFITGNTIVDALTSIRLADTFDDQRLRQIDFEASRVLLVTAHRRENHGAPLASVCRALKRLAAEFDDVEILYPVHLNPNVRLVVGQELEGVERVHLVEPLTYGDLLRSLRRCYLALTDSGGIQEEAPSFHKPVLVLREVTERPEVIEAGAGKIVGTDAHRVFDATARLLGDPREYQKMCSTLNPFGDGRAAERIVAILAERL